MIAWKGAISGSRIFPAMNFTSDIPSLGKLPVTSIKYVVRFSYRVPFLSRIQQSVCIGKRIT